MKKTSKLILTAILGAIVIAAIIVLAPLINPGHSADNKGNQGLFKPSNETNLIFVHHSTGENLLSDDNGKLAIELMNNNYYVSDTNYGWGPENIGDRTDIGNWWEWFRGPNSSKYLNALYNEKNQTFEYSRLSAPAQGENQVIIIKSCFPNSALKGSVNDPIPNILNNPLVNQPADSEYHTIANAKGIYLSLLQYFITKQDKLFIIFTAPPLTDPEYSKNARSFNLWLVNDYLKTYSYKNVAVFDFYNVLTTNAGSPDQNDFNSDKGNHHLFENGRIAYITSGDDDSNPNISEYSQEGDDHPTQAGNEKATKEFITFLNYYYSNWKSGSTVSN